MNKRMQKTGIVSLLAMLSISFYNEVQAQSKEIQNTVERRKEERVIKLSAKHFKKLFVHSKMSADRQNQQKQIK